MIDKHKNNIKRTWQITKEIIGKSRNTKNSLLRQLNINDSKVAEHFNKYFVTVGPNLAQKFFKLNNTLKIILPKIIFYRKKKTLTDEEFKKAFFSLKINKSRFGFQKAISTDHAILQLILNISCGVPQGSILGPLLFLLYVNDVEHASKIIKPIMFADDTNLFYSHKELVEIANDELVKTNNWFKVLNADKTKYTFFPRAKVSDNLPLRLPTLKLNNCVIKREHSIKFLGVLINENLTWKTHINNIENEISKSLGMLYKAKFMQNQNCLKSIFFSFIHCHLM